MPVAHSPQKPGKRVHVRADMRADMYRDLCMGRPWPAGGWPWRLDMATAASPRPTILRSYGPTILRSYGPTILRSYGPTILRSYGPSILRSYGPSTFGLSDWLAMSGAREPRNRSKMRRASRYIWHSNGMSTRAAVGRRSMTFSTHVPLSGRKFSVFVTWGHNSLKTKRSRP